MRLFNQLKIHTNESGIILVTVLLVTIILSVVAISILSLNVSQVKTGQSVVDNIKAEYLARGAFIYNYQEQAVDGEKGTFTPGLLNGKTYTITTSISTNPTDQYTNFTVSY